MPINYQRAQSDIEIAENILNAVQNKGDRKLIVALTGAGISAESGIPTFRDSNGLWENHKIEDVASPRGWQKSPETVLHFYNLRRAAAANVEPNAGHFALKALEEKFLVVVITQNIDPLHEKADSTHVLHLHGELSKVRSTVNDELIYEIGADAIQVGDLCEDGYQLRPHIVWFEEMVPMITYAASISELADYFLVVGTSLLVYPAAGLIEYARPDIPKYIIDKNRPTIHNPIPQVEFITHPATVGVPLITEQLLAAQP